MLNLEERRAKFEILFEKHSDLLYRIALVKMRNREDAEDAVQDTFIKYLTSPFDYKSDTEERAWLVRVLNNRCSDLLKRRNLRTHTSLDEVCDLQAKDEFPIGVFESVSKLSEKYRTVIVLHYLEGFSVEEIANSLSLTKSNVKMRLMRGREELVGILGKENISV